MIKKTIFLLSILALSAFSYCQDVIYRNNGDSIVCKIIKVDDEKIYFNLIVNERVIPTHIEKSDVIEYKTNVVMREKTELNYKGNLFFIAFDLIF